jgi:hypothetical protein
MHACRNPFYFSIVDNMMSDFLVSSDEEFCPETPPFYEADLFDNIRL